MRDTQPAPDPLNDTADEPLRDDHTELTPPHGDALRGEATFGRTDRYTNIDDEDASREEPADPIDDREADAGSDVRRGEHSAD